MSNLAINVLLGIWLFNSLLITIVLLKLIYGVKVSVNFGDEDE